MGSRPSAAGGGGAPAPALRPADHRSTSKIQLLPAGLSAPFHHGNFASIPRVTGSPSAPPKSSGHRPFGTTSAEMPRRRNPLPNVASRSSGSTARADEGSPETTKVKSTGITAPVTGTAPVIRFISLNDTLRPAAL